MRLSRRQFIRTAAAASLVPPWLSQRGAAADNAFAANWESLSQYRAPDWFRDAKFGIWAHWSAQCVPEQGDWYARHMYLQGTPQYDFHAKTYGHPSKFGFMELDNLWKAERWEPAALMQLYVAAGAKYFVSLANHHDNFDNYASNHHAWNSVNVGPKKDIVGIWAKTARAHGLRFGVSNHSAHAWHWFQTAYGYDGEGPLAGARYDAATLTRADGKGKWWEGLDPQQLYTGPTIKMPDGIRGMKEVQDWHEKHTRPWTEMPPANNPEFVRKWSLRCQDLIDQHRPDLVYFDNFDLPLGQAGLDIAAYYYNASRLWNGGRLEAVVNTKMLPPERRSAVVEDIERGVSDELRPQPWQTDTCLGNWHYDRALLERHGYKSAATVLQTLCDVVSKNGNLLLSVPLRGDGTIDEDERAVLTELAAWMAVNGEAIFATRPWKIHGEGPTKPAAGLFSEGKTRPYTSQDLRFTTKGGQLYALTLSAPLTETQIIKSLASGAAPGTIERVEMLGIDKPLTYRRTTEGLIISLPQARPEQAVCGFRISGRGLVSAS